MKVSKIDFVLELSSYWKRILKPATVTGLVSILLVSCVCTPLLAGQTATSESQASSEKPKSKKENIVLENRLSQVPRNLLLDQKGIWLSPLHFRAQDANWAVPFTFATALTFGIDHAAERNLPTSSSTISRATSLSNYGAVAFAGTVAGTYFWGLHTHDEHLRRTGLLSGEAAVDAFLLTSETKILTARERPAEGLGQGRFFESNTRFGSSFPSQHAAAAWAIAEVFASEYPGPLTKLFAYGGASAIGAARIIGQKHFPSDVLIGSALGWYAGRYVYRTRSPRAENIDIGTIVKTPGERNPGMMGSPYVPLDSWVYPVFDRLSARGFLSSALMGLRPWTRMECARLLVELEESSELTDISDDATESAIAALNSEFAPEKALLGGKRNLNAEISSVYTRTLGIAGDPVSDSLHFGQTVINDYGRPYQSGLNQVIGATANGAAGPLAFYVTGEYQYAPSADPLPLNTRTAIAQSDGLPIMPGAPISAVTRFRLLDSYVALNLNNWQLSFGRQSLWWGPGTGQDLMMSDNAEPLWMLRLSRTTSTRLPGLLRFLGPARTDTFLGQIQGYHFLRLGPSFELQGSWDTYINPQPAIWGSKINFKPTPNLELGFSITTIFAGLGRPLTLETFKHTFSSSGNAQAVEPGDRRTGFDFSYRIPGLRRWVTIYNGSLAEDEPNPIGYPRRSAMNPGIYFAQLPKAPKLDLRLEAAYTNVPNMQNRAFFYTNAHYAGGYSNFGEVMGSWVGPQGIGLQAWSTYWFHPRKKLQFGWRQRQTDHSYLQGGRLQDFSARFESPITGGLSLDAWAQYEQTKFPVIAAGTRNNLAVSIMLTYRPGESSHGRKSP